MGTKKPNELGILDMSGNVSEWCWDFYAAYTSSGEVLDNPVGPSSGTTRVIRGGANYDTSYYLRVSAREAIAPDVTTAGVGFRTVLPVE